MFHELMNRIHDRTAVIGVIGLGYVGLPLAERAGRVGFRVLGSDVSTERVAQVNRGESYIGDVSSAALAALRQSGRIEATTDVKRMEECDLLVICVPTPLNATRDPDIRYVEAASENIAASIRPGQLVILESTTYPGTTRELVMPVSSDLDCASVSKFSWPFHQNGLIPVRRVVKDIVSKIPPKLWVA